MEIGEKVGVNDMGFMGLETYYGKVLEIISPEYIMIDFGEPCLIEGKIRKIHVSRLSK